MDDLRTAIQTYLALIIAEIGGLGMLFINLEIFYKSLLIPLRSEEKAILLVIASYVQKDKSSCFPSYAVIKNLSGACDVTIKDTIDLLSAIGVLEYRNRSDIGTGKKNNEYSFVFTNIKFYKSKGSFRLSEDNAKDLKALVSSERVSIKANRKEARLSRKRKINKPDNSNDNPITQGIRKSQNLTHKVRGTKGSMPYTITPSHKAITPSQWGRSSIDAEKKDGYRSSLSVLSDNEAHQSRNSIYLVDNPDLFIYSDDIAIQEAKESQSDNLNSTTSIDEKQFSKGGELSNQSDKLEQANDDIEFMPDENGIITI